MKYLLILALASLLSSCGGKFECDHEIQGLCVVTEGHDIDVEAIDTLIDILANAIYNQYGKTIDLEDMFLEHNVSITYVDFGDGRLEGNRGLSYGAINYVSARDCWEKYYVAGHELMHAIAIFRLGATHEENHDHMIPGLFFEWARQTGASFNSVVEFDHAMYFHVVSGYCAGKEGFEEN